MLTEVKKSLNLLFYYMKFNLSSVMEYRVSFLIQSFGMVLNNSAFIFFWWILFENVPNIGGYGFKDVMLLWSLASTGFGITFVMFGNLRELTRLIINGELDTYLLQPRDPLMNILCSKTNVSAWGDMLYGIILYFMIMGFNPLNFLMYALFCITSAIMLSSVIVIGNTFSFYLGDFQGVSELMTEFMLTFSIYPEGIFSGWMRYVLYTVLPIGFVAYIPASTLMSPSILKILAVMTAAFIWMLVAYFFFYKGLKRYESGNLITNKL